MRILREYGLYFAWVISLAGLLTSLFYSEIAHFEPCNLCWIQRIALFPMAIQLGIAAYRSDGTGAAYYCIPLCFAGFAAAVVQSLVIWLGVHGLCGPKVSCQEEVIYLAGYFPLPWACALGFALIAALIWINRKKIEE